MQSEFIIQREKVNVVTIEMDDFNGTGKSVLKINDFQTFIKSRNNQDYYPGIIYYVVCLCY